MFLSAYEKFAWGALPVFILGYCMWALTEVPRSDLKISRKEMLSGNLARDFEETYRDAMPMRDAATNHVAALRYWLLDEARAGAVVGRDDWLFTQEEVRGAGAQAKVLTTRIAQIAAAQAAWEARGAQVVVLPLPAKIDIERAVSPSFDVSEARAADYSNFVKALTDAGIPFYDTRPAFQASGPGAFFARDTHWTPDTAFRVAEHFAMADVVPLGETIYKKQEDPTQDLFGDLLTYIGGTVGTMRLGLAPEPFVPFTAVEASATLDLFGGGETADIILVGTSYSANPAWSFAEALRLHLRRDILNYAQEGKGPLVPMQEVLGDVDLTPNVVLWEIPVRYLTDESAWKKEGMEGQADE